jgi:hypothetical protein
MSSGFERDICNECTDERASLIPYLSAGYHIFDPSLIRSIGYRILGDGGITYARSKALLSHSLIDCPGTAGCGSWCVRTPRCMPSGCAPESCWPPMIILSGAINKLPRRSARLIASFGSGASAGQRPSRWRMHHGRGHPGVFPPEVRAQVTATACQLPRQQDVCRWRAGVGLNWRGALRLRIRIVRSRPARLGAGCVQSACAPGALACGSISMTR